MAFDEDLCLRERMFEIGAALVASPEGPRNWPEIRSIVFRVHMAFISRTTWRCGLGRTRLRWTDPPGGPLQVCMQRMAQDSTASISHYSSRAAMRSFLLRDHNVDILPTREKPSTEDPLCTLAGPDTYPSLRIRLVAFRQR